MFPGIVAGALAGGAGQVISNADEQIKQNNQLELDKTRSQLDIDKAGQIARINQQLALDMRRAELDTSDPNALGSMGIARDVAHETAMTPILAERERATAKTRADQETASTIDRGTNPTYLAADRAIKLAGHINSPSEQKVAYELGREKMVNTYLDTAAKLRDSGNEEGARKQEQLAATVRGNGTGNKSFSDIATMVGSLQRMASDAADPLKNGGLDPKDAAVNAKRYTDMAVDLIQETATKKNLSGSPSATTDDAKKNWPKAGAVVNGMTYNGGDPNQKSSWTAGSKPGAQDNSKPAATDRSKPGPAPAAPDSAEGTAFDKAKMDYDAAATKLGKYGQRQRAQDPSGYAAAVAAEAKAKQQRDWAQAAYERTVGGGSPSFRTANP
jgi:hypothetical protein